MARPYHTDVGLTSCYVSYLRVKTTGRSKELSLGNGWLGVLSRLGERSRHAAPSRVAPPGAAWPSRLGDVVTVITVITAITVIAVITVVTVVTVITVITCCSMAISASRRSG